MILFSRAARWRQSRNRAARFGRFDPSVLLLLAPAILILLVFRIGPLIYGAWLSFQRWNGIGDPEYVGLANYRRIFTDPDLAISLRNNLLICLALLIGMVVPLLIAVLLHGRIWGWQFFRIVFFLPVVLSPLVIGLYWAAFLRSDGPLDVLLRGIGLNGVTNHLWLAEPTSALIWIALILNWATLGVGVILFMAGLSGIDPLLYDAAAVDGANWFQTLRHITIPELRPVALFWAIQLLIFSFTNLFAFIYILTGGGPGSSTSVVEFQLYSAAFLGGFIGYGSAIGVLILVIVFAFVATAWWWFGRSIEESEDFNDAS